MGSTLLISKKSRYVEIVSLMGSSNSWEKHGVGKLKAHRGVLMTKKPGALWLKDNSMEYNYSIQGSP